MPIMIIIVIIAFFVAISLFAFPRFSPIPYFPSNMGDKDLILKALDLKNDQTVIDLGAGDGWVIFEAAREAKRQSLNVKLVAVEINPILVLILYLKRLFHPNKKNIDITRQNMFKLNVKRLKLNVKNKDVIIYLYISPWLLEKTLKIVKSSFPQHRIVSYMYPIKSLKENKIIKGKNNIYIYARDSLAIGN